MTLWHIEVEGFNIKSTVSQWRMSDSTYKKFPCSGQVKDVRYQYLCDFLNFFGFGLEAKNCESLVP